MHVRRRRHEGTVADCPACGLIFCPKCEKPFHGSQSCEDVIKSEEDDPEATQETLAVKGGAFTNI